MHEWATRGMRGGSFQSTTQADMALGKAKLLETLLRVNAAGPEVTHPLQQRVYFVTEQAKLSRKSCLGDAQLSCICI